VNILVTAVWLWLKSATKNKKTYAIPSNNPDGPMLPAKNGRLLFNTDHVMAMQPTRIATVLTFWRRAEADRGHPV